MQTSEKVDMILGAIVKAVPQFGPLVKSASNPHFKSRYLPLDGLVEAVAPALFKEGILLMQGANPEDDNGVTLITRLIHAPSGQYVQNTVRVPMDKGTAQGAGSAITYARRYGLQALLGLVAEEDDDGNAASAPPPSKGTIVNPHPTVMPMGKHEGKPMKDVPGEALVEAQTWALANPTDRRAARVLAVVNAEMERRGA